jgi:hypothetical protein
MKYGGHLLLTSNDVLKPNFKRTTNVGYRIVWYLRPY